MVGRSRPAVRAVVFLKGSGRRVLRADVVVVAVLLVLCGPLACAQQRREREANSVYAARRAKLASEVDAPILLWGFTGREESTQTYVFAQEENFYYLTGHNEEGAGLILLPSLRDRGAAAASSDSPREILFLPPKDSIKEKWNGPRMSPADPGIEARTGFNSVKPFPEMRATLEELARRYPAIHTILPYARENGGYPHEKEVTEWIKTVAP